MEPRLESFLAHLVALRPERCIIFDLLAHHRIEDDGDFMRALHGTITSVKSARRIQLLCPGRRNSVGILLRIEIRFSLAGDEWARWLLNVEFGKPVEDPNRDPEINLGEPGDKPWRRTGVGDLA